MEGEIWDVEVCAWALRELCALAIQERVASSVWLEWGLEDGRAARRGLPVRHIRTFAHHKLYKIK